jgi:two-component system chemotaxis response regulator CheY
MRKKILIVDDSPSIRKIIENFLEVILPDAFFHQSGDGLEAEVYLQESYLNNEPVDLVFLDWMMPKLNGHTFLENIRAVKHFSKQPYVIMLTAETYPHQINLAIKHNVVSYVTKPFSFNDLRDAVKKVPGFEISDSSQKSVKRVG